MFDNKVLVNLYVLSLDKNFEIYFPINEKVGNILTLLKKSLFETDIKKNILLLNLNSGTVYNYNDIVRKTDIKNGVRLMLV